MKKSIFVFLLHFILFGNLLFFNKATKAVQVGDRIEIPLNIDIDLDDGSNCKNYSALPSCTIGFGDRVEILEIKAQGKSEMFVLKYFPGNKHWDGKCQPSSQSFCFYSKDSLELFHAYSALEPRIEAVTESEELPKTYPVEDNNSAAIVKGQIFSTYNQVVTKRFYDIHSVLSWEFISEIGRRLVNSDCHFYYGYKLKTVGFNGPHFAYVRLMKPEYEKQVVAHGRFYNCPVNSLFRVSTYDLITNEVFYRDSLKLREDFLKALISSRLKDNLFELPLTKDGLTVGQNAVINYEKGEPIPKAYSFQNIDFKYLLEQERNDLGQFEDLLRKKPEEIKSLVKDLNPLFFTTIPMINWWSCHHPPLVFSNSTSSSGSWKSLELKLPGISKLMFSSSTTGSSGYWGRIIGFTEINSELLTGGSYSIFPERFAIVENEFVSTDSPWESLRCKFVLIPTFELSKPELE